MSAPVAPPGVRTTGGVFTDAAELDAYLAHCRELTIYHLAGYVAKTQAGSRLLERWRKEGKREAVQKIELAMELRWLDEQASR